MNEDNFNNSKEYVLKKSNSLDSWPQIKGYNVEEEFDLNTFLKSLTTTGQQATELGKAIEITKYMRRENATIFLGFTSNAGTSGIREYIMYLFKHKKVHVGCTTVGAIEEDIIKCFKPFVIGDFRANGAQLREEGINRTGNIFIPNDRYVYFDKFMRIFLERLFELQQQRNEIIGILEFVYELGRELELQEVENKEESFTYWAYKNNLPFFCPTLLDGSLGDMVYFFKKEPKYKDFKIDMSEYIVELTDLALNCEKMGIIALGGSVPKHALANAGLFRDGAEYCVYLNSGLEMEGSNAGAPIDEAVSWGKVKANAHKVKVEADFSLTFPLLVLGGFKD
ncbi:MAG: deoxyhypusine synthase [Nanoarchaeota archaeon]|nr:deoxyhypusine synthase [Nanoarchaeota archaeon]